MANLNAPFGFRPIGRHTGADQTMALRLAYVPSSDGTALYLNDVVKSAASIDPSTPSKGCIVVTAATAGDTPRGIVVGVLPVDSASTLDLGIAYRKASTAQYILINEDPHLEMEVQYSGTLSASSHLNANLLATTAGSATTNLSGMQLDTVNTTSTLVFRIVGVPRTLLNNAIGQYAVVRCVFNVHELGGAGAGSTAV